MRTATTALVLVLACSTAPAAAAAPDASAQAKEKLEALRKELPGLLEGWSKKPGNVPWLPPGCTCRPEVRLPRRLAPGRAKLVVLFAALDDGGRRWEGGDLVLTAFLAFEDGGWTSERSEVVGYNAAAERSARRPLALLVLAIDEAAEK